MTIGSGTKGKGQHGPMRTILLSGTPTLEAKLLTQDWGGYTYCLKDIWDGLDRQARSQPSLVLQVNRIKKGD